VALALARAAPAAWYLDPARPLDVAAAIAELDGLLARHDGAARPVVVLDGADLAILAALVASRLSPRLLVVVPCPRSTARQLPVLAGRYPRSSILVIAAGEMEPEPEPERDEEEDDDGEVRLPAPPVRLAGDRASELAALIARADDEWHGGDRELAVRLYREVAEGRRALGDPAGAATALQATAEVTRDLRRHEEAAAILEEAHAIWTQLGDLPAQAQCRLRLGQFADRRADPRAAAEHYAAALVAFRALRAPPEALERLEGDLDAARAAAAGLGQVRERPAAPPPPAPPPPAGLIPADALRRRDP
jgi:tetratricopeptide (TPR) repeat protein